MRTVVPRWYVLIALCDAMSLGVPGCGKHGASLDHADIPTTADAEEGDGGAFDSEITCTAAPSDASFFSWGGFDVAGWPVACWSDGVQPPRDECFTIDCPSAVTSRAEPPKPPCFVPNSSCYFWGAFVRFVTGTDVRIRDGSFVSLCNADLGPFGELLAAHSDVCLGPRWWAVGTEDELNAGRAVRECATGVEQADDNNEYLLVFPRGYSLGDGMALVTSLNVLEIVEFAGYQCLDLIDATADNSLVSPPPQGRSW